MLDNIPENRDAGELAELQEASPTLITALGDYEPHLERVADGTWQLSGPDKFAIGRIGEAVERVGPPSPKDEPLPDVDPLQPKWGGITYHPKLSVAERHIEVRRRKGEVIYPHGFVFGADDRQVFYPTGYPWRCVGRVFAWTDPSAGWEWYGSGALVGPNVMVTSAHIIPWDSDPWMMQFVPAYYDGGSLYSVSSYVQSVRGYESHGQGDDMAVCKLYTPLGSTLGWFGTKTYHDSWEDGTYWTKVGYASMVTSQRPNRIQWFPIVDDDSDGAGVELEYKADASGGDSGGPVFGWWSNGPHLVGAHSGGETEYHFPFSLVDNNVGAGGAALPNLVNWAHNNW